MKFSIRLKLIVFTFFIVLLVGGSISVHSIYQGRQRALTDFKKEALQATELIARTIVDDIYFLDIRGVRSHLESSRANPDISYTYVMDLEGVVLSDGTKATSLRDRKLTDSFSRAVLRSDVWISQAEGEILKIGGPVLAPDNSRIGHLQVGFSLAETVRAARAATTTSLYITVICLGIGAILAVLLSVSLSRPILAIVRASREIGDGKLDTRLPANRRDELGALAASTNQMAEALQRRQAEDERKTRELQALYTLTNTISQSLDIDSCMQAALMTTIEVLRVDAGRLYVFDEKDNALRRAAHHGIPLDQLSGTQRYAPGEGVIGRIFRSNRPIVFTDVESDPNYKEMTRGRWAQKGGYRSAGGLPITIKDRPVGVIYLFGKTVREFTPQDIELLSTIGRQIGVAIENARLFGETKSNLERVKALREIDQAITSALELRTVLDVLMEKIDLVLPYSATTVRLFNKASGLLEPIASRNLDEKEWKAEQWKGGRGIPNVVFETKAPWAVANLQTDPRVKDTEFFRKHGLVSYLGVPLIVKDEILGVLGFYTKAKHEFTGEEIEFLSTLAGRAAIVIHNARLYEETERRRREAEELARVAQSLTESLDMTAVGERIVTSVRELFGVRASMLRLLQPDGSLRALASSGESFLQASGVDVFPPGTGLVTRAVAEGRAIWSADVLNEPGICLTDQMRDYQLRSGNRSMIAVPLRAHETIIGSLGCLDQTGRVYSDNDVALLQTFADQAALALEKARLYKETQIREAQLQETNRRLSALYAVAAASQSLDRDRVLNAAIEKITELFRFDATQIHLYDERAEELRLGACFQTDPIRFAAVQSFRSGQGIVGKVAESGKALIFEDVQTDPLYQQLSRTKTAIHFGYHFFAVFPIRGKRMTMGTLACTGADPRKLKPGEIQLLEAMTDQIAVAIENGALYEEVRERVLDLQEKTAELERANRVKDEFLSVMSHELRTPLNVIMGYTGMIRDGLLGEINPEQEKALEKVISRTRDQLTMITSILDATQMEADRVKAESHETSLVEFLDDLRNGYEIPLNTEATLRWDYPADLPVVKTDGEKLKHVLQNLINNAIKFTAKGSVTISAWLIGSPVWGQGESKNRGNGESGKDGAWIEFKVEDTGVGIPPEHLPIIFEKFHQVDSSETRLYGGVGIGLYIVKQFTELLGGKIKVESEPGQGSTFSVTIPCDSQPREIRGRESEAHSVQSVSN